MSVSIKDKTTGEWVQVAGNGKAEYGASTERKGDIVVPATTAGNFQTVNVVFAQAMPDNDYTVVIDEGGNTWAHCTTNVTNKTATGFTLFFLNVAGADAPQMSFKYRAFKLYTDTEYNNLLDLPDRVETLETVTNGTFTKNATNVSTVASAELKLVGGSGCLGLVCSLGVEVSAYSEITLGTITIPGFSNVNGQGLGFNQDTGARSWVFSQNGTIKLAVKGVAVPVNSWIYASIPLVATKA